MHETIEAIRKEFTTEIENIQSTGDVESLKVKYLGRKGPVQQLMKALKEVSSDQRPELGKLINTLKEELGQELQNRQAHMISEEESKQLIEEKLDETLPGRRRYSGRKHVVLQTLDRILNILIGMGFSVQYGPDIDTDYYNFECLNFPDEHPARDMQDTFYISEKVLLRTHTSNTQVRVMESNRPPIRVVSPGKAYRNEAISARSHVFFHQVEGFYIDKGVSFADLISTIDEFLEKLFQTKVKARYRPSYFPFVEPGMEVDVHCINCDGKGCAVCKHTGWLEVMGAGMIHPEVLKNGDIDPEEYTGYAWGLGVERLIMLIHKIPDIRYFTHNDIRFLRQFTNV